MSDLETSERSLLWRLLPWLVPLALILVGLVFIAVGLGDDDSGDAPERDAVPATVSSVFTDNAQSWAVSQVGPGISTVVSDVVPVGASATGASTFSARAVIVRHDAVAQPPAAPGDTVPTLPESETSTVATCVLWNVDAGVGSYVPLAAAELVRAVGVQDLADSDDEDGMDDLDELRDRCKEAVLPG